MPNTLNPTRELNSLAGRRDGVAPVPPPSYDLPLQPAPRSEWLGYIADSLQSMQGGLNRVIRHEESGYGLGNLVLGEAPRLMDDISYGDMGVQRTGHGYKLDPAYMDLAPVGYAAGVGTRLAGRGAKAFAQGATDDLLRPSMVSQAGAVGIPKEILGQYPASTAGRIQNKVISQEGYSVSPETGIVPDEGIMMGKFKNTDPRNMITDKLPSRAELEGYAKLNKSEWSKEEHYFGVWKDPADGKTYLDVSKKYGADEIRKATKAGERTGQKYGFDLSTGKETPVGNWEEFINGEEFASRLDEMESVGAKYLEGRSTGEWWDMHGTSFEDVYGKKKLPQVAGYTSATAPNTAPRENLQTMSEYMRRDISGEPIIQPEWRVPEGAMSRAEGTQLGMEAGRKGNLIRTHEGRLGDLGADKVRNEAEAMMGDPNAVVLDRHWARIAEDPIHGVFTDVQEGKVAAGKVYDSLKDAVSAAAMKKGRTPRDFSADVWTGIRETIKNKNKLFGVNYRKGSITGESQGYADHFTQLIKDKARHLGITVNEMQARLKKGDANLLSLILATPIGMALYQESQRGGAPGDL